MTDLPGPSAQRIGDRERDQAAEFLRDHMAEGRHDQEEFDERLTTALTARTQGDLDPLFLDLPSPKPSHLMASPAPVAPVAAVSPWLTADLVRRPPQPVREFNPGVAAASALIWPLMIFLIIVTHGQFLPILVLPFLLPWILGRTHRRSPYRR